VLVHGTHGTTLKPLTEFSDAELIRYLGKHYVPLGAMRGKTMDDKHRRSPTRAWRSPSESYHER
jgi:hypothetical protein